MKYNYKIIEDCINDLPIIVIEGDMTSDGDDDVKRIFSKIKRNYQTDIILINFEKTKFINSSGIATLINIIQDVQEKNGDIAFVGLSAHFRKVIDIVGISDYVHIFETNQEAADQFLG